MIRIVQADFIKGATKPDSYPATGKPEFAFFGRSNTGKSSLINMIVNRKSLVKTGSRPGVRHLRQPLSPAIHHHFTRPPIYEP